MITIGRHCCLLCLTTSEEQKVPPAERTTAIPQRSLAGIKADYNHFMSDGGGDLKKAKLFNNVIAPHFFDIELDQYM